MTLPMLPRVHGIFLHCKNKRLPIYIDGTPTYTPATNPPMQVTRLNKKKNKMHKMHTLPFDGKKHGASIHHETISVIPPKKVDH